MQSKVICTYNLKFLNIYKVCIYKYIYMYSSTPLEAEAAASGVDVVGVTDFQLPVVSKKKGKFMVFLMISWDINGKNGCLRNLL